MEHVQAIGHLTNGAFSWTGGNAVKTETDETGGLLLEASETSGTATVTINGHRRVVALTNVPLVALQDGRRRLLITGPDLTQQAKDSIRQDMNHFLRHEMDLSIEIEVVPAPTKPVQVEIRFYKRHHMLLRPAE